MGKFEFKRNNFDLIRLIAALQVAIVHGHEHFGIQSGKHIIELISIFPGVPIFFVISGFLISASWERSSSILSYFENRALRIYPALWVCLLISIISAYIVYPFNATHADFFKWIIAQISFGQFYNPEFLRGYGVGTLNGSLWTIPVELQFYLILPFLFYCFNKVKWNIYIVLPFVVFLMFINQIHLTLRERDFNIYIKLFGVTILPHLYMFMIGIILQKNILFVSKFLANKVLAWLMIYAISVLLSYHFGYNYSGNYTNPFLAILISLLTISFAYSNTDFFGNLLKENDISYGIYIYHMVFVNFLLHINYLSPIYNFFLMILLTILMAFASWRIIEKPALKLKRYSLNTYKSD